MNRMCEMRRVMVMRVGQTVCECDVCEEDYGDEGGTNSV